MAGIENLLGGFVKGIAMGRQQNLLRERQEAKDKREAEMHKLMVAMQKTKQADLKLKNDLLTQLAGLGGAPADKSMSSQRGDRPIAFAAPGGAPDFGAAGSTSPAKYGKSFSEPPTAGTGVSGTMAQLQTDPQKAAVIQSITDIPLVSAINAETNRQRLERGESEWKIVKVPDGQGGYFHMKVGKYDKGGGEGELVGYDPPRVDTATLETPKGKYKQPISKVTGQPVGEPVKVGKVKGETAETASKIALATNAVKHIKTMRKMFVNKNGTVNRQLVFMANAPMGGIGEGRMAYGTFIDALDARARAATGAAMPESEIATYKKIYWPSPLDTDATIVDKINRLSDFMDDFLTTMDPEGTIRKRMRKGKSSAIIETDLPPDKPDFIFNPQTQKLEPVP